MGGAVMRKAMLAGAGTMMRKATRQDPKKPKKSIRRSNGPTDMNIAGCRIACK